MSLNVNQKQSVLATAAMQPSLFHQVGMAGGAAVITVTFIHPIDVIKVSRSVIEALSCLVTRRAR